MKTEMNIVNLFHSAHAAIEESDLVYLKDLVGKDGFPTKQEFNYLISETGVDEHKVFYNPKNIIERFLIWDGFNYIGIMNFERHVLNFTHVVEHYKQKQDFFKSKLKNEDYNAIFQRTDKKILIPMFIKEYKSIPDKQKYDVFKDLYIRSEYGFGQLPSIIIKDLVSKRELSEEWHERMNAFSDEIESKKNYDGTITVYRGEGKQSTPETTALSWTLDKQKAEFFANRFSGHGRILKKNIKPDKVIDFLQDRGESEILIIPDTFSGGGVIPVGVFFLGAPASGKGYIKNLLSKKDGKLGNVLSSKNTINLTVDVLRAQIQSMTATEQLLLFHDAFYIIKEISLESDVYSDWFNDISRLWIKIANISPRLKIETTNDLLVINNFVHEKAEAELRKENAELVIRNLDSYEDYKRVIRGFQFILMKKAILEGVDVIFDETGGEPEKILPIIAKLKKSKYETEVFIIQADNVATNILNSCYRIVTGHDGGRDSSGSIVENWNNIKKRIGEYEDAANNIKRIKRENLDRAEKGAIIDNLTEIVGGNPKEIYQRIGKNLDDEQKIVFDALLFYNAVSEKINLPHESRKIILSLTSISSAPEARKILDCASRGSLKNNYKFPNGGISDRMLDDVRKTIPLIDKPINVYFDLDGVLINFDNGIADLVDSYVKDKIKLKLLTTDDYNLLIDLSIKIKKEGVEYIDLSYRPIKELMRRLIANNDDWWSSLDWMPYGKEAWQKAKKYNPIILSSPLRKTNSLVGKMEWIKKNLGKHVVFLLEDNKEELASKYSVLVDNNRETINKFIRNGGRGIFYDGYTNPNAMLEELSGWYNNKSGDKNEKKYWDVGGFVKCHHCGNSEK